LGYAVRVRHLVALSLQAGRVASGRVGTAHGFWLNVFPKPDLSMTCLMYSSLKCLEEISARHRTAPSIDFQKWLPASGPERVDRTRLGTRPPLSTMSTPVIQDYLDKKLLIEKEIVCGLPIYIKFNPYFHCRSPFVCLVENKDCMSM
jgi:hypothetical protein